MATTSKVTLDDRGDCRRTRSRSPSLLRSSCLGPTFALAEKHSRTRERGQSRPASAALPPHTVTRPIVSVACSVYQTVPLGPIAMPFTLLFCVGVGNDVAVPVGVIRPIPLDSFSENQRLPSGPVTILHETAPTGNVWTTPDVVILPMLSPFE